MQNGKLLKHAMCLLEKQRSVNPYVFLMVPVSMAAQVGLSVALYNVHFAHIAGLLASLSVDF